MYFNWVPNWIDEYFFNKISDFLLGLIFISLLSLTLVIYKSKKMMIIVDLFENHQFVINILICKKYNNYYTYK